MDNAEGQRVNLLSIGERAVQLDLQALIHSPLDGGSSGLLALYTIEEILSRLAFDLKSKDELMAWRHFKMMIGTGPGG
jgi:hypothetical protein